MIAAPAEMRPHGTSYHGGLRPGEGSSVVEGRPAVHNDWRHRRPWPIPAIGGERQLACEADYL